MRCSAFAEAGDSKQQDTSTTTLLFDLKSTGLSNQSELPAVERFDESMLDAEGPSVISKLLGTDKLSSSNSSSSSNSAPLLELSDDEDDEAAEVADAEMLDRAEDGKLSRAATSNLTIVDKELDSPSASSSSSSSADSVRSKDSLLEQPGPVRVLPLYSVLPTEKQMLVFDPPKEGERLIVVGESLALNLPSCSPR